MTFRMCSGGGNHKYALLRRSLFALGDRCHHGVPRKNITFGPIGEQSGRRFSPICLAASAIGAVAGAAFTRLLCPINSSACLAAPYLRIIGPGEYSRRTG